MAVSVSGYQEAASMPRFASVESRREGRGTPVVEAVCYKYGVVSTNRKAKGFPE
jgi:hypothetical protein